MSRDEVAVRTRIPIALLQALESGQAERLPERIFVINYIRAYAQTIGISVEDAVLRYDEIVRSDSPQLTPPELEKKRRRHAWRVLAVLVVVLGVAVAAFVWLDAR